MDQRHAAWSAHRYGAGRVRLHLHLRQGLFLSDQRSCGLRELPCDGGAVFRLDEVEPPRRRDLQRKYATKAENGFWHSFYFTTGTYPENIQAREISRRITESQCRRCHTDIATDISAHSAATGFSCIACHGHVGHAK